MRQRVLVLLTAIVSSGCVYAPVKNPVYPSALVGDAGSQSPIRIGAAIRTEVIARFGKPTYSTEHQLAIGYLWGVKVGHAQGLLFGPCSTPYLGSHDDLRGDGIWLEFDDRGVLKRYVRPNRLTNREQESWLLFCVPVPDTPRADQLGSIDDEK